MCDHRSAIVDNIHKIFDYVSNLGSSLFQAGVRQYFGIMFQILKSHGFKKVNSFLFLNIN